MSWKARRRGHRTCRRHDKYERFGILAYMGFAYMGFGFACRLEGIDGIDAFRGHGCIGFDLHFDQIAR